VSQASDNVVQMSPPKGRPSSNGNGNGHGTRLAAVEARLTTVEARLVEVGERLAMLETRMDYLATKEDIQAMQASMLKWGIGILATAVVSVLVMAFRLLS